MCVGVFYIYISIAVSLANYASRTINFSRKHSELSGASSLMFLINNESFDWPQRRAGLIHDPMYSTVAARVKYSEYANHRDRKFSFISSSPSRAKNSHKKIIRVRYLINNKYSGQRRKIKLSKRK